MERNPWLQSKWRSYFKFGDSYTIRQTIIAFICLIIKYLLFTISSYACSIITQQATKFP